MGSGQFPYLPLRFLANLAMTMFSEGGNTFFYSFYSWNQHFTSLYLDNQLETTYVVHVTIFVLVTSLKLDVAGTLASILLSKQTECTYVWHLNKLDFLVTNLKPRVFGKLQKLLLTS